MKRLVFIITALAVILAACTSDADVASKNLSVAAEQFEIQRRIIFYNGITDTYMQTIEGACSIEAGNTAVANSLEVTCRVGDDAFVKHFLGLSDNVTFFVEQLVAADVDVYHHRVIFKPEVIVPDIDLVTSDG
jgi:ABC-type Fe3+-hydroxamate transport system substrate-binding protein